MPISIGNSLGVSLICRMKPAAMPKWAKEKTINKNEHA